MDIFTLIFLIIAVVLTIISLIKNKLVHCIIRTGFKGLPGLMVSFPRDVGTFIVCYSYELLDGSFTAGQPHGTMTVIRKDIEQQSIEVWEMFSREEMLQQKRSAAPAAKNGKHAIRSPLEKGLKCYPTAFTLNKTITPKTLCEYQYFSWLPCLRC